MSGYPSKLLLVAIVAGVISFLLRRYIYPDAKWWDLVMIGLLLLVLVPYLWRERNRNE